MTQNHFALAPHRRDSDELNKCIHHLREGTTYDNRDREINDIAAIDKFSEIMKEVGYFATVCHMKQ